jgi:hypothetical protein
MGVSVQRPFPFSFLVLGINAYLADELMLAIGGLPRQGSPLDECPDSYNSKMAQTAKIKHMQRQQ